MAIAAQKVMPDYTADYARAATEHDYTVRQTSE